MKSSLGLWLFHDLNWCRNRIAILPVSLFKSSDAFVYKCQFPSHRDVEDQRLVMVLVNTQRLNNRLHSELQTQCLGESASGSRYLLGPAWFHLSLTLPPGSSHCVTCRTGHTRTAFPSARPGPSILHFLGNWCLLLTLACELVKLRVSPQPDRPTEMLTDAPVKAGRVLGIEDESRLMRGVGCPDVLFAGLSIMKLSCGCGLLDGEIVKRLHFSNLDT